MGWSKEIREVAIRVVRGGGTYEEAAAVSGVGVASVNRWLRLERETGSVAERARGGGNRSRLEGELLDVLVDLTAENDNRTDAELCEAFVARTGVQTSRSSIRRALARIGFSRKKSRSRRPSGIAQT